MAVKLSLKCILLPSPLQVKAINNHLIHPRTCQSELVQISWITRWRITMRSLFSQNSVFPPACHFFVSWLRKHNPYIDWIRLRVLNFFYLPPSCFISEDRFLLETSEGPPGFKQFRLGLYQKISNSCRGSLGCTYRHFIRGYSCISAPINLLSSVKTKSCWAPVTNQASERLKNIFTQLLSCLILNFSSLLKLIPRTLEWVMCCPSKWVTTMKSISELSSHANCLLLKEIMTLGTESC